ncbi:MAG: glutathione S-transferase family protein [Gallionellaceae bacterium]
MITLYALPSDSPNIRKITLMLDETGLPYTIRRVDKQSNGELAGDFIKINPNATVPAIEDKDTGAVIFESGAILYYLAEKSGKLLPKDLKDRADMIKWLMFEVANMGPTMAELHHYLLKYHDEVPEVILQRYKNKIAQYCSILNQQLIGREFICGDRSIADIALYPWTIIFEDMADLKISDYPNLLNWESRMANRLARHAIA